MNPDTNTARFPETSWGLVTRATAHDEPVRERALSDLCEAYWPPLYAFARHSSHSPQDAEDLTQGFLVSIVEHDTLSRADQELGKLRTFLLGAFKRFMARENQYRMRLKRGGGVNTFSIHQEIGEQHFQAIQSKEQSPDVLFDQHWLLLLFDRTLNRLREQYEQSGKSQQFDVLKHFLDDRTEQSYDSAAAALGMQIGAVRVAVHRMHGKYRELLRNEIRLTLPEAEDPDKELQYLASLGIQ